TEDFARGEIHKSQQALIPSSCRQDIMRADNVDCHRLNRHADDSVNSRNSGEVDDVLTVASRRFHRRWVKNISANYGQIAMRTNRGVLQRVPVPIVEYNNFIVVHQLRRQSATNES